MPLTVVPGVVPGNLRVRGPSPWIDAKAFGVLADNTTDDTAALQRAIDAATTIGTDVFVPAGRIRITNTITISRSGVMLRGPWTGKQTFPGVGQNDGVVIRWDGADGGTMLDISPGDGAVAPLHGVGLENIILDGDGSAGRCLRVMSAQGCTFRNSVFRHATVIAFEGGSLNDAPDTGVNCFYRSLIDDCVISVTDSGIGLRLTGSTNVIGGENTSFVVVRSLHVTHKNGTAILIDDADDCGLYDVGISRISGGAGIGVDLSGGNDNGTPNKGGARYINLYNLWPGPGGVTARATGFDRPALNNAIYGYNLEDAPPLPIVEDGASLAWTSGNGYTTGLRPDGRREIFIKDDFGAGTNIASELTWQNLGGTATKQAGVADHPGIVRYATSAVSGTLVGMTLGANAVGMFLPAEMFDMIWIVKLNTNDTDTLVRIGLVPTGNSNPDNNGIYVEKLAADTSWFGVTRAGSSTTRTAALTTVDTNWIRFRVRRKNATAIGFTVGDGSEVTATATIPTVALQPFLHIRNAAAADKTIDIDFFSLRVTGLSR